MNDQARSKAKQVSASNRSNSNSASHSALTRRAATKDIVRRAADQAKRAVTKRIAKPGMDIDKLAKSLRLTGQQLEGNMTIPYVDKLAGGLEQVASFIEQADSTEMVRTVERYARQRPFLFVSGAIGVGVLAGRFLKSTAADDTAAADESGFADSGGPQPASSHASRVRAKHA